jgi:microcystin-dependent protein
VKRAPFLGATAATLLAGCGGSHAMRALPGVASSNSSSPSGKFSGTLVPVTPDPIPDTVLNNPFIGEARRFDGSTVPSGWVLAQGQALPIADNPRLFSILGHSAQDRATTTFALPNPGFGYVVASAGMFPTSPGMLTQSGRRTTSLIASLGPGARSRGMVRILSAKQQAVAEKRAAAIRQSQQLSASAPRPGPSGVQRLSPEFVARIDRVQAEARTSALAALSGANQTRVGGLVSAILAGRTTVQQATVEMASALSGSEARALLEIFDGTERALRQGWSGMEHPDPQTEASRYVVEIAFTSDQLHTLRTMAQSG